MGRMTSSARPWRWTPGGVAKTIRIKSSIAITTPIPRPREMTQTAVKARALRRERAACKRSDTIVFIVP